ncbi:hypothetical protein M0Q50_07945 [bacterium]|jgi:hypothetical protein|nr:hypothetical protein [bacterium]
MIYNNQILKNIIEKKSKIICIDIYEVDEMNWNGIPQIIVRYLFDCIKGSYMMTIDDYNIEIIKYRKLKLQSL